MKKSIENYNNIKLCKSSLYRTSDESTKTEAAVTTKNLIFKTKTSTKPSSSSQNTNPTLIETNKPQSKVKIKLKRSLDENGSSDKYNLRNSFDESEDDDFNVFDLNTKTSHLSIKKSKTDSSPSSSTSSYNDTSPSCTIAKSLLPKKIDLKLPESDDEDLLNNKKIKTTILKNEDKSESPANENTLKAKKESDEPPKEEKLSFKKETKPFQPSKSSFKDLDDLDDDLDEDLKNVKKFKLVFKKDSTNSASNPSNLCSKSSSNSQSVIKHKIFNSKQSKESKANKVCSFKLNFNNENDQDTDELTDSEENSPSDNLNKIKSDKLGTKSKSLSQPSYSTNKSHSAAALSKSNSVNSKLNPSQDYDLEASVMVVNLRNTRRAYECEELGEAQAFLDDFNYLMDGLNSKYKLSERCLSSIKLAELCLSAEFRMNLRSSISNDDYYINKIFKLLDDSTKYKSLSLCTSLIIFALTQDKLIIDIDNSIFNLIIKIIKMNELDESFDENENLLNKFDYLNDLTSKQFISPSLSLASSPTTSQNTYRHHEQDEFTIDDNNDDFVYKKIISKCRKLFENLNNLESLNKTDSSCVNLNSQLVSLDCLLNLNQNMKKNLLTNDFYKNEFRLQNILDKILIRIKLLVQNIKSLFNLKLESSNDDEDQNSLNSIYLLGKLKSCLNLLGTLTQSTSQSSSNHNQPKSSMKSIKYIDDENKPQTKSNHKLPGFILTQNYLIDYKNNFLIEMIKESLNFFFEQLKLVSSQTNKNQLTNALKELLLLMINITHNNEYTSKRFASDLEFSEMLFKYLDYDSKNVPNNQMSLVYFINEDEQFDILIMLLGVLLNLFVNCFKQKTSINLLKCKNKKTNLNSIEIILNLYKTKEALVTVAENNQENEFNQLNEQIESQNMENINLALMNSIHKAGKHMEDHIIAAHSALIIGYMLLNDEYLNKKNVIDVQTIKASIKEKSFKNMIQIVRKFLVFMKMMKVSGFSADEHIEGILEFMEKLDTS